jgi:hypothetical protein
MNYCFWLLVLGSAAAAACEPIDSSAASDAGPLDGGTSAADSTLPLTSAPMSTPSAPTPTTTPMATATATPTSTATATATPTSTATATATSLPASTATATATATESSAPLPPNLITNGDFADGTAKWAIVSGTAKESIVAGYLCVAVAAANDTATIVLGWPEPAGSAGVPLSATGSYTFSYTAYATKASVTVAATVGDSVGPDYLPVDFVSKTDAVKTTATTFTHPFTPASGADPSAGLSFGFVSNVAQSVCFANVSVVED